MKTRYTVKWTIVAGIGLAGLTLQGLPPASAAMAGRGHMAKPSSVAAGQARGATGRGTISPNCRYVCKYADCRGWVMVMRCTPVRR